MAIYVTFEPEEKIKLFDEIADCFYNANFGQFSKSDIELISLSPRHKNDGTNLQTNLRITLDGTLLNGWLIGRCSRIYEKIFDFQDRLSLRKFFA